MALDFQFIEGKEECALNGFSAMVSLLSNCFEMFVIFFFFVTTVRFLGIFLIWGYFNVRGLTFRETFSHFASLFQLISKAVHTREARNPQLQKQTARYYGQDLNHVKKIKIASHGLV